MPCNAVPRGTWLPSLMPKCSLDFEHLGPHKSQPISVIDYSGDVGATRYTRIAVWETDGMITWVRADDFRAAKDD